MVFDRGAKGGVLVRRALGFMLLVVMTLPVAAQRAGVPAPASMPPPQYGGAMPVDSTGAPASTQGQVMRYSPVAPQPANPSTGSTGAQPSTPASLGGLGVDYRISPNDLFDVEVFGVPDLKRTVRVNASGLVSLPMLGAISVVGLTAEEAEVRIAKAYSEKLLQDPQVSVFIREFSAQQVTLEGAVRSPGIYTYTGTLTLLQAIARAGGRGELADFSNIMVFRRTEGSVATVGRKYDGNEIQSGVIDDPILQANDVIVSKRSPGRVVLRDSIISDVIGIFNPFSYLGR